MNQILSLHKNENSETQLKKIIKYFSIFIIIFALILVSEGGYGYFKSRNTKRNLTDTPQINIERNNGTTKLKIYSNIGVQKIVYSWNDGIENTINQNGENNVETEIPTTIGTNDLNIKIIDSDGNTITYNPVKISYDETTENQNIEEIIANDKTKPTVNISTEKGKIKIIATDDVKMSYITYSWNDEEETKVTGLSEDEKTLTTELDLQKVKKGDNKLVVKAYDLAGNVETVEKSVKGANGSEIKVNQEGDELVINVKNEIDITKIVYKFNGEESTIDNINKTEYEFRLTLKDGENKIEISAYAGTLKSDYENTFSKKALGNDGPKITVAKDSKKIIVNVSDENSITNIKYNFNGEEKTIDNINKKEYTFELNLIDGENYIIINAYNSNNMSEYKGKTRK